MDFELVNLVSNNMDRVAPIMVGLGNENSSANKFVGAVFPGDLKVYHSDQTNSDHPYHTFLRNYQIDPEDNPILFSYNLKPSLDF